MNTTSMVITILILFYFIFIYQRSRRSINFYPIYERYYYVPSCPTNKSKSNSLNDRVNEHYMKLPIAAKKEMGDITKGLWQSGESQAKRSNDGRLYNEEHAISDSITPEHQNTKVGMMCDIYLAKKKSKINNFVFEDK